MYIKLKCPVCGNGAYHNVHIDEKIMLRNGELDSKILDIRVTDSCPQEEMWTHLLRDLVPKVKDGMTTGELYTILEVDYGILASHCYDAVQRIMVELDMYCPDRVHLRYVER